MNNRQKICKFSDSDVQERPEVVKILIQLWYINVNPYCDKLPCCGRHEQPLVGKIYNLMVSETAHVYDQIVIISYEHMLGAFCS